MPSSIIIGGLDPSLNNFGMCKGTLDLNTGIFDLRGIHLSEAKSDKANKKTVRKNSDDLNRAKTQYEAVRRFFYDTDIICVEVPVGSQSARSMASYGICIGILASIEKQLIQVTPNEVKIAATGNKQATKRQMIEWAASEYPEANWLTRTVKGQTNLTDKNEHIADSIAALHAGVRSDQFQTLKSILTQVT